MDSNNISGTQYSSHIQTQYKVHLKINEWSDNKNFSDTLPSTCYNVNEAQCLEAKPIRGFVCENDLSHIKTN
jgi:hypothetical protein